ncbi:GspE/PulE family protein [Pandoraea pnomenusa]|nr:GspE/PulE family protein [Pandoraea pnomenusa]
MTMPGVVMRTLEDAERHERVLDTTGVGDDAGGTARRVTEISRTSIDGQSDAVVRLVDAALLDALRARASDIHVETAADGLAIRYRIDGVLHLAGRWPGQDDAGQAISRLKVLAGLDIGERRVPQDGRFRARIEGGDVDFRVSVMPSIHGEDAVLRILDKRHRNAARSFTTLGLDTRTVTGIRAALAEPHGMLLVTGPTGSGKSTTLHTALAESDSGERKLITIEDPIEYELPGVLQIPVNEKKGLTFARGLRSILRHDPDTILVGEIRDGETATIAVQAALTGHLVLSSLHANSAFGVLERLLHMGLDPVSVTEALRAIVAQRLVRRVCEACAVHDAPPRDATAAMRLDAASIRHGRWRRGVGCEACRDTGYAGRIAVAEWLKIDDAIAAALRHRAPATELRRIAREGGHVFMNDAAVAAARAGATTLQEVIRVFGIS